MAPLICLGGLLLAVTCAAKPPAAGGWPDTLSGALVGCGVALVGVVLWRRQPEPVWADALPDDGAGDPCPVSGGQLGACVAALQAVHAALPGLAMPALLVELETIHTRWVLPLSRSRQPFMAGVDRAQGATRLALFARGELWLNRARSAAGDQHREEARRSLAWAVTHFQDVQRLLDGS
ncbi:MAG: hypothetical protein H7838_01810 [Magnetococcus sp. DMHC-8]